MKGKLLKVVSDQMELAQDDISCILDGIDDKTLTKVCQAIVNRFNIVKDAIKEEK